MDKVTRTIDEFIQNGKLSDYSFEVEAIIKKIFSQGCLISCHYISEKSSLNFGPPAIIRIEMSGRHTPTHIIWDILHEYGHFLSGQPETGGPNLKREIEAWNFAKTEINNYPKLIPLIPDFESYSQFCIQTYQGY